MTTNRLCPGRSLARLTEMGTARRRLRSPLYRIRPRGNSRAISNPNRWNNILLVRYLSLKLYRDCFGFFDDTNDVIIPADENGGNTIMASQLNNIRLKLEEKRRHIENEKRRMEVVMSKQRQKVGKAAFLQAVTKVKFVITLEKKNDGDHIASYFPFLNLIIEIQPDHFHGLFNDLFHLLAEYISVFKE